MRMRSATVSTRLYDPRSLFFIYRFNALGWTQEEIGRGVGLTQQAISLKLQDLPNLVKLVKAHLERGESISDVAEKQADSYRLNALSHLLGRKWVVFLPKCTCTLSFHRFCPNLAYSRRCLMV